MSIPDDKQIINEDRKLKDADDNNGTRPEMSRPANPAAAERVTDDHDPHNIVKDKKQYDSPLMENDK